MKTLNTGSSWLVRYSIDNTLLTMKKRRTVFNSPH